MKVWDIRKIKVRKVPVKQVLTGDFEVGAFYQIIVSTPASRKELLRSLGLIGERVF